MNSLRSVPQLFDSIASAAAEVQTMSSCRPGLFPFQRYSYLELLDPGLGAQVGDEFFELALLSLSGRWMRFHENLQVSAHDDGLARANISVVRWEVVPLPCEA